MKFKHKLKCSFALSMALSVLICGTPVHASDIVPEQNIAAQWVKNAVKITFDSNDGGVAPNTQVYTYGVERSLPGACAMKKEGYVFKGWAETASATTAKWEPGATSATAFGYADANQAIAKTLYAFWGEESGSSGSSNYTTSILSKGITINGKGYVVIFPTSISSAYGRFYGSWSTATYDALSSTQQYIYVNVDDLGSSIISHNVYTQYNSTCSNVYNIGYVPDVGIGPFTVNFTKSINVSGDGVQKAILYLETD